MDPAIFMLFSLAHQTVGMRMQIDLLSEGLDANYHTWDKLFAGDSL
jgi:hypothetical protein